VAVILDGVSDEAVAIAGPLVTQHMWGGISLAAVCWVCWILRLAHRRTGIEPYLRIALAAGVGLVFDGLRGGQLSLAKITSHEHMPGGFVSATPVE